MPRVIFNDGEEITLTDLNNLNKCTEKELFDRIAYELGLRQSNFVYGGSFAVAYVNSTTVSVQAGNGFYLDNTQTDPEPQMRLLHTGASQNLTLAAPDSTNPRIDLVYITPARAQTGTATRNFKDANTGVVSQQSMETEDDWTATVAVVTGTPAGSPAAPATPAGSIALAQCLVSASSGMSGSTAVTDKRSRFKKPSSFKTVVSKTSAYTADWDDELILCNATSGGFTVTIPLAVNAPGKEFRIKKTDSSANLVTISGDLIDGVSSQTLDSQNSAMNIISDGTGWDIV